MKLDFKTKACNLENLSTKLKSGKVLPLIYFTVSDWNSHPERCLSKVFKTFGKSPLIARSSCINEDAESQSLAGHFSSILNINTPDELKNAILQVIGSYRSSPNTDNQILIQPMLKNIEVSGVAFTRDLSTHSHYFVINYDQNSGTTDSVTSGRTSDHLKTLYIAKSTNPDQLIDWQKKLVQGLIEIEGLYKHDAIDIEFAFSQSELYILQARPLALNEKEFPIDQDKHRVYIRQIKNKVASLGKKFPYLAGDESMFGVMPDWNPAEIIGIKPRPLAMSFYKELITNSIWAASRDRYGYKNLRSFPLLISLAGMPYIDIRVSFNSFIPEDIDDALANKLVNYYLNALKENPNSHDKVEFEIIFSCYTFDFEKRVARLLDHGFSQSEVNTLTTSIRNLTNNIIDSENGLWKEDFARLQSLKDNQETILNSDLNEIEKIYWLLEDCKRYGTLPFAGLARAGFVAIQILKSMVSENLVSKTDYEEFINSLSTISSQMNQDFEKFSKKQFLKEYGHLRPGTYNILKPSYSESFDKYFSKDKGKTKPAESPEEFSLSLEKLNKLGLSLKDHNLKHDVVSLFNFLKGAIEGREYAKFLFTKNISESMRLLAELGGQFGFSKDDISFANIDIIPRLYSCTERFSSTMSWSIGMGKKIYGKVTNNMVLPPLITSSKSVEVFELPENEPNFITLFNTTSKVITNSDSNDLNNSILMIPSADPGFDWIFTHNISGFITMYGGANSHMAIRAGELGIPAVIGAGELLFNKWSQAEVLHIDCSNKKVEVIR